MLFRRWISRDWERGVRSLVWRRRGWCWFGEVVWARGKDGWGRGRIGLSGGEAGGEKDGRGRCDGGGRSWCVARSWGSVVEWERLW